MRSGNRLENKSGNLLLILRGPPGITTVVGTSVDAAQIITGLQRKQYEKGGGGKLEFFKPVIPQENRRSRQTKMLTEILAKFRLDYTTTIDDMIHTTRKNDSCAEFRPWMRGERREFPRYHTTHRHARYLVDTRVVSTNKVIAVVPAVIGSQGKASTRLRKKCRVKLEYTRLGYTFLYSQTRILEFTRLKPSIRV